MLHSGVEIWVKVQCKLLDHLQLDVGIPFAVQKLVYDNMLLVAHEIPVSMLHFTARRSTCRSKVMLRSMLWPVLATDDQIIMIWRMVLALHAGQWPAQLGNLSGSTK
jgi:hypothetical protein